MPAINKARTVIRALSSYIGPVTNERRLYRVAAKNPAHTKLDSVEMLHARLRPASQERVL